MRLGRSHPRAVWMRHRERMREWAVLRWVNLALAVVLAVLAFSGLHHGGSDLTWAFLLLVTGVNIGVTVEWLRQYHLGLVHPHEPEEHRRP
jgi:hypothetical protein